ncbi:MAG: NAD(P)-dependent oxidoreductase [Armatimonadetes bacterium]|nr:NAD(P)-dependent oxidoreductase [Armatimonadota bacterium]
MGPGREQYTVTAPAVAPQPLGFIGLGAMGGPMARNLCRAGYEVLGYDLDVGKLADAESAGVTAADDAGEVVARCEVVLTSLRSSETWVELAETELVPHARSGQVFIDMGTVAPPATRRIAASLAAKGAALVDAPVSGGPGGAASGTLRIFAGGDPEAVEQVRPILEVLGDPERVVYCGPSGSGQVVKGCNQLAMGLADAAYMEALSFGVAQGIDPLVIAQGVGGEEGWRSHFAALARHITAGHADECYVKYPELPYFIAETNDKRLLMPLMRALYAFSLGLANDNRDNMGRPTIAFWRALMEGDRDGR